MPRGRRRRAVAGVEDVLTHNCSEHRRGDERRKQDMWNGRDPRDLPLPPSHIPKPQ